MSNIVVPMQSVVHQLAKPLPYNVEKFISKNSTTLMSVERRITALAALFALAIHANNAANISNRDIMSIHFATATTPEYKAVQQSHRSFFAAPICIEFNGKCILELT